MSASLSENIRKLCTVVCLAFLVCLPFLVPFDPARNIDLQGIIVLIAGGFGVVGLALSRSKIDLPRPATLLGVIFLLSGFISLLLNPHLYYNLLGAPHARIGLMAFITYVVSAFVVLQIPVVTRLKYMYMTIVSVAVASVPYALWNLGTLERLGGVFAQADIFACLLGVGILIGLSLLPRSPRHTKILYVTHGLLITLLFLSETRAVLIITALLWLVWLVRERSVSWKRVVGIAAAIVITAATVHALLPSRLTDVTYAKESFDYRLALKREALSASADKPFFGYGPGNLADALDCRQLNDRSLQTTCEEGYFFNSSHNIFLDRILTFGWIGGLSFVALLALAIRTAWRAKDERRVFAYMLLLFAGYYLTNVTHIVLELLLWIALVGALVKPSRA